jgi:transcriptional regulator with XRE-family HTH domain
MSDHAQHPHRPNDLLRELRVRSGLSQRELARRAGVAGNTVLTAERGTSAPSVESQQRITAALVRALTLASVADIVARALDGTLVDVGELWPETGDDEELEAIAA